MGNWAHILNFNEAAASPSIIRDYSTNGFHSTSVSGLTTQAGVVGREGVFVVTPIGFGVLTHIDSLAKVSLDGWFNPNAAAANGDLYSVEGVLKVYIDASEQPNFELITTVGTVTITGAALTINTRYNIQAVYDGADMFLYIDGVQVATAAQTGALETAIGPTVIGDDGNGAEFFQGEIEEMKVWDDAFTLLERETLFDNPAGARFELSSRVLHSFVEGDLIQQRDTATSLRNAIISLVEDATFVHILNIGTKMPYIGGGDLEQIGHAWDDTRQSVSLIQAGETLHLRGISDFAALTVAANISTKDSPEESIGSNSSYVLNGDVDTEEVVTNSAWATVFAVVVDMAQVRKTEGKCLVNVTVIGALLDLRVQENAVTVGSLTAIAGTGISEIDLTGLALTGNVLLNLQAQKNGGGLAPRFNVATIHHGN